MEAHTATFFGQVFEQILEYMIEYEGKNDWCREEGLMTGKFDGKTKMQQRMLENEKKGKKFSVVQPRLR